MSSVDVDLKVGVGEAGSTRKSRWAHLTIAAPARPASPMNMIAIRNTARGTVYAAATTKAPLLGYRATRLI
jgi:hypothetical protein